MYIFPGLTLDFDGIQLFRDNFGSSYRYDNNGNVTSVVDQQKQTTGYEYQKGCDVFLLYKKSVTSTVTSLSHLPTRHPPMRK